MTHLWKTKNAPKSITLSSSVREGHGNGDTFDPKDFTRFYVLGLSPNASRISVRFWKDTTVGEMKARLAQHLQDTDLVGAREYEPPLMIRRIVLATGRAKTDAKGHLKNYDADTVQPLLAGEIARAVFTGGPYPRALLTALINRMRADGVIRHERIAAIKGCLVRNSRLRNNLKEVPVALDTIAPSPAYVTGRLFALLEKIQSDSRRRRLNATIKDRYFSAASATPGMVFPRLIRLSQHHLGEMETGSEGLLRAHSSARSWASSIASRAICNLEEQGLVRHRLFPPASGPVHKQKRSNGRRRTMSHASPKPLRFCLSVRRHRRQPQRRPDAGNLPADRRRNGAGTRHRRLPQAKVSNYVGLVHGEKPPYEIYMKERAVLNNQHSKAVCRGETRLDPKKRKSKGEDRAAEDDD